MPNQEPISAARFSITIDGYEVGRFEEIYAATAPGAPDRKFQPHELSLLCQPPGAAQTTRIPNRSVVNVTMKRGVCSQALISRWQMLGASSIGLVALGSSGQPIARYELTMAWPRKYSPAASKPVSNYNFTQGWPSKHPSGVDLGNWAGATGPDTSFGKGGSDVAIEEIVIAHEGMRLH